MTQDEGLARRVGGTYRPRARRKSQRHQNKDLRAWRKHCNTAPVEKRTLGMEGNMDAKKITGMLVAVLIAVPLIATAPPGTLALLDVALIGLLFGIRRQRVSR